MYKVTSLNIYNLAGGNAKCYCECNILLRFGFACKIYYQRSSMASYTKYNWAHTFKLCKRINKFIFTFKHNVPCRSLCRPICLFTTIQNKNSLLYEKKYLMTILCIFWYIHNIRRTIQYGDVNCIKMTVLDRILYLYISYENVAI